MDLFEHYETLPNEVTAILDKYCTGDNSYENCNNLITELNAIGYTCDYGLDGDPYGLKVLNCPICDSTDTRDDLDSPDTMNCCNKCGADFLNDGEVTLDPRNIV